MSELKDKIVTLESLSTLHDYNKSHYMTKAIELGNLPLQCNPADFTSFILEVAEGEATVRHIIFTDITVDYMFLDTVARAFQCDENGAMRLYELRFYWGDGGYMVDSTLSTFEVGTGTKTSTVFEYEKIYGVQYI